VKSLRLRYLAISSLLLVLGSTGDAIGQINAQPDVPTKFDIPAQPLIHALDAYSAVTGLMVLYDSGLAEERRSTAVSGVLMPDVAIRVLLEGTSLTVFNAGRAFAIEAGPSDRRGGTTTFDAATQPYLALVQKAIERTFCEKAETRPGRYRAALQFSIDTAGEVLSPELMGSTGDPQRDRIIVELLGRLRLQRGPPPGMTQPISMIIAPKPPAQSGDCASADNSQQQQARP
jgi:hypothetical protein